MKRAYIIIALSLFGWSVYSQSEVHPLFAARSFLARGEYKEALATIRNSSEGTSDYRFILFEGEIFMESGDYDSAIKSFTKANSLKRSSGDLGLAKVYASKNDSKLGTLHLEQHLRSEFKEPLKKLIIDKRLQRIEGSEEWKQLWKKRWYTQLEDGIAEVEYTIGRGGSIIDARESAEAFIGLYSERAEVDYVNGLIFLAEGNYENAIKQLSKSIEKDNTGINVWIAYIDALGKSGDFLGASRSALDAISIFPDQLSLYQIRIDWLRRAGDREQAVKEVAVILEYYPGREDLLDIAGKLAYETRSYSKAIQYSSENIDNHPGNPDHYVLRGNVYMATRTWEFAINDYSMALDLDPKNGDVYYNKAIALIETGENEDACHDLLEALKLGNKKASALINKLCIR